MSTPTTFTLYQNRRYSGWIIQIERESGPLFGRTQYDPDAIRPGRIDPYYDKLPAACIGMNGDIYTVNSDYDGANYTIDVVRWPVDWAGGEPAAGFTAASAVVGALPPEFYGQMACYIVPGGESVQVLFKPNIGGDEFLAVAISPEAGSFAFTGCRLPNPDGESAIVGLLGDGRNFIATGGQLM